MLYLCILLLTSFLFMSLFVFFFFKQKTAYELRISDWSSDVCSSDLIDHRQSVTYSLSHMTLHFFAIQSWPEGFTLLTPPCPPANSGLQIGRASCRERVCRYV